MSTELETRPRPMTTRNLDPAVHSIIEAARSAPTRARARAPWVLAGTSAVLFWASFPPLDWGPLGWIALVPLLLLVRVKERLRGTLVATFAAGVLCELALLQWLRYGDPAMYPAWGALAVYMGLYFPVFLLLSRAAVHRFQIPLVIAAPTVWVALEYLRAHLMTGFAWYYLGHTQYRFLELIQISDLLGAYGVSFVLAAAAAALAMCVPLSLLMRFRLENSEPQSFSPLERQPPRAGVDRRALGGACFAGALVLASIVYGIVRRGQALFVEGPRIALVQGNFTSQVKHDPNEAMSIFTRHYVLTGDAVKFQPDLIVWPETMYRDPLMIKAPKLTEADLYRLAPRIPVDKWNTTRVPKALDDISRQAGTAMIFGIDTFAVDAARLHHYNSAAYVLPGHSIVSRYDKLHRVVFGEYIPLRDSLPFLARLVPYGAGFGIDAGQEPKAFVCKQWRLAPLICFEDTVPHLVRRVVEKLGNAGAGEKPVDCLVNLTNDGWFHGSSGLDQHLITSLFRCIECRKPMVRAVNGGISAVIDGDGVVVEPDVFLDADGKGRKSMRDPKTGHWYRQLNAVLVDSVPLDNRKSVYLRSGDWFAGGCAAATLLLLLAAVVPRRGLSSAA